MNQYKLVPEQLQGSEMNARSETIVPDIEQAVSYYLSGDSEVMNQKIFGTNYNKEVFNLHEISLHNKGTTVNEPLSENEIIQLNTVISINNSQPERYHITYHIYNELGEAMFSFSGGDKNLKLKSGLNKVSCRFPASFFQSGQYFLSFFIVEDRRKSIFVEKDIISFTIVDGEREIGVYMGREPGYIKPQFEWSFE